MIHNDLIPYVIEKTGRGERAMDIFSRLLRDRIVFVHSPIMDETASTIVAQLLFLANEDTKADIHMYVMCPGGSVSAGLAIYDTMQLIAPDVCSYCIGHAESFGAILLTGGTKGKRYVLPNATVMIHQPLIHGSIEGSVTDLDIEAKEMLRIEECLYELLSKHTGKDVDQIRTDCDRNYWMNAADSVAYGLADQILSTGLGSAVGIGNNESEK